MIKAAIFDLDGVIVESEHAHITAEKQTMLKHGVHITSQELHKYTGTTARLMFTELIRKYNLNTTFEEIFTEKEEIMFRLLKEDTRPTEGVIDLLHKLKQRNIRLAIASSSHRRLVDYVLERLNIKTMFDSIMSAEDVVHSKPDPEIFLKSARALNVSPSECLVVEDAALGVEAAKRAGMKCVGYMNPNSGHQDLSRADIAIDHFCKLDIERALK